MFNEKGSENHMKPTLKNYIPQLIILIISMSVIVSCDSDNTSPNSTDDTAEVEFTNVRVEELTSRSAVIRFTTSQPTTCDVVYGIAEDMLDQVATDPNMLENNFLTDHDVPLEDLLPEKTYYYKARATTEDGLTYFSSIQLFTTKPETADASYSNIALQSMGTSVTSVSSNWGNGDNDSSFGANNAIDGMMSTEWSTNGDGDEAFITLDFGQQRTISRFGFRSRKMMDGSSIITGIRLTFDGDMMMGPFETPDPDSLYTFDLTPPVTAQTVRVDAVSSTGGNTGAKEIQFFSVEK